MRSASLACNQGRISRAFNPSRDGESMEKRIIVGLNGASGIIYGNRTLMHLRDIEDLVCAAPPNACGVGDG